MKFNLHSLTKEFILNEGKGPTINSWIQALAENIGALKPRSLSEERRVEVMKHQLRELRRSSRRMQEQITTLEEQVTVLQEGNNE
jgi:hypothetical protein|tara:strand:+ start:889 stop:1143 length:255 start_codon:yes stop_codon:yes gene_type:complete